MNSFKKYDRHAHERSNNLCQRALDRAVGP